jgi:GTP-binding protein
MTEMPVYRVESDPKEFSITQTSDGWRITGVAIERAAKMTYWENMQSIRRFQRILKTLGIDEALRKAGVENGDTVYISDFELEWQD